MPATQTAATFEPFAYTPSYEQRKAWGMSSLDPIRVMVSPAGAQRLHASPNPERVRPYGRNLITPAQALRLYEDRADEALRALGL